MHKCACGSIMPATSSRCSGRRSMAIIGYVRASTREQKAGLRPTIPAPPLSQGRSRSSRWRYADAAGSSRREAIRQTVDAAARLPSSHELAHCADLKACPVPDDRSRSCLSSIENDNRPRDTFLFVCTLRVPTWYQEDNRPWRPSEAQ
jgi:hypothetical protein